MRGRFVVNMVRQWLEASLIGSVACWLRFTYGPRKYSLG